MINVAIHTGYPKKSIDCFQFRTNYHSVCIICSHGFPYTEHDIGECN